MTEPVTNLFGRLTPVEAMAAVEAQSAREFLARQREVADTFNEWAVVEIPETAAETDDA
jgi:hypothetical protein